MRRPLQGVTVMRGIAGATRRQDVRSLPGLTERPMFGGLRFRPDRPMSCAARQGRAMARLGPDRHTAALIRPHAGWVRLAGNSLSDDKTRARLAAWAPETVRALPPKE